MTPADRFPGVECHVGRMELGAGVRIEPGAVIVADDLVLGDGALIEADCDVRAARVEIAARARLGAGSRVLASDLLRLDTACVVDRGAEVTCRSLAVGEQTYLGSHLRVGCGASMEERSTVGIGSQCQIAPEVIINATEPVVIGDRVGMSMRVALWTHGYHSGHAARDGHVGRFAGITVEDGVWLAYDVAVMPGVRIGAGTQVAARAVVVRSLPPGVLAAGVPAVAKRTLHAAPLEGPALHRHVEELVAVWLERLVYKGVEVCADEVGSWRVKVGHAQWTVRREEETLRLSRSGAASSIFDFRLAGVVGELDELGHDFRDHCRRQSWMFPYPANSVGLIPHRFSRLLGAHPLPDGQRA
ncbi:acyltransferase [Streptomyces sp. NPDC021100]|uniref:acyltransferase n=1 Tax=Streptomyces sp. NPDC021100 TaxID=3365114 RepID=UPI0037A132FD